MRAQLAPCLLLLALLGDAALGEEPWYNRYETGLRAIESQDWAQAEAALEQALAANAYRSRRARTYGTRYIVYIPDYYLGVVYFNQRRYEAALAALERAQSRGQVSSGDPEWAHLNELKLASRRQLEARSASPPSPPAPGPSPTPREPDPLLSFGREQLDAGRLEEARRAAQALLAREPGNRAAADLLAAVGRKEALARGSRPSAEPAPPRPSLPAALPSATPRPASPEAGPSEREAYLAYFRGDFERALELLRSVQVRHGHAARPLFYMACSNASLALMRGRQGEHLLNLARDQLRAARDLDTRVTAEAHWISPAVLAALQSGNSR